MTKLARYTAPLVDWDVMVIEDDFTEDLDTLKWTTTATDTGSATVGDARNGLLTLLPADGTVADNDEIYLQSANELFLVATDCTIYGRCRLSFVETASGVYNAAFGFANAPIADTLIDNGGGVRASGSLAVIYKVDGETTWRVTSRVSTTVTITQTTQSAVVTSGVFQELEVFINDYDGTSMQVAYKIDGKPLRDSVRNLPITHFVPISGATEMAIFVGAKLGAITNNDGLVVDRIYGHTAGNRSIPG